MTIEADILAMETLSDDEKITLILLLDYYQKSGCDVFSGLSEPFYFSLDDAFKEQERKAVESIQKLELKGFLLTNLIGNLIGVQINFNFIDEFIIENEEIKFC